MFRTYVEQPVFNLLEVIYGLVPGHDLGISIILFTLVIRLALWPLVQKQLHHARAMRKLQPELKKIKKAAKGDRQKEARLQMELYKEHEIRPLASIGTLIIQIPIFIALYQAVLKLINDPSNLISFSYSWVRDLPQIREIAADISKFDPTFIGVFDLREYGIRGGTLSIAAISLAVISSFVQYKQMKLTMRDQQDSRKLSEILKDASSGKQADQGEVTAAVSKGMLLFLPFVTFVFAINVPSALSLYFLTSSAVGWFQQWLVFRKDQEEMSEIAREPDVETEEVVAEKTSFKPLKPKNKKTTSSKKKKRR